MSGLQDAIDVAARNEHDALDEPLEPEGPEPEVPAGAASSVLQAVRQRAHQLQAENIVELPIPGFNEVLWGRYRAVSIARFYSVTGGGQLRNPLTEWGVAADALATALEGLYGRNAHGELEPLDWERPTRFDDDLVAMLGLEPTAPTARAVLVALLGGGELGESRVWSHFMGYQNWLMEGSAQEVADDAVGESSLPS